MSSNTSLIGAACAALREVSIAGNIELSLLDDPLLGKSRLDWSSFLLFCTPKGNISSFGGRSEMAAFWR
jgi:hypothetical protein